MALSKTSYRFSKISSFPLGLKMDFPGFTSKEIGFRWWDDARAAGFSPLFSSGYLKEHLSGPVPGGRGL